MVFDIQQMNELFGLKSKRGIGQIFRFGLAVLYSDWPVYNPSEPINNGMIPKHVQPFLYFSFVCIANGFIIVRSSGQVLSLDGVALTNSRIILRKYCYDSQFQDERPKSQI